MRTLFLAAVFAAAATTGAFAQPAPKAGGQPMMKGDHAMHGGPAGHDYMMAMQRMHQQMMQTHERDPDRAFAKMMIEHHRGAVAMSEVLLKHGKDAELKRMAQKSMDSQKKEIGELQSWLSRHGGR